MSRLFLGYFTAFLLPLLYLGMPNPVLLKWHYSHGQAPPPADVSQRAERVNNLIPFVALVMLFVAVSGLLHAADLNLRSLGLTYTGIGTAAALGISAGLGWLLLYASIFSVFRPAPKQFARHLSVRWSLSLWLALSLLSAIIEEIWRAGCLVSLTEHGNATAVLVTGTAYGLAHLQPLGRALSAAAFGVFAAWLYLTTRLLLTTVFAHLLVNVGVFFLTRLWVKQQDPSGT